MIFGIFLIIVFYGVVFALGFVFGRMDRESKEKPQETPRIEITHTRLKQWSAVKRVGQEDFRWFPDDVLEDVVVDDFSKQLKKVIKENMIAEKDITTRQVVYRIDAWFRN